MDEPFEEWVQNDAQQPCVKNWAKQLIQLGTSWDSFRRDDEAICQDLVQAGGIPLLAARDIVKLAKEEIERANAPMAVFWDLENMPIPTNSSGRDVTSRLKKILSPYGNLVQFRAYASIGLNLIPQQKRSDLQLSGCHLVDCPHNGRKEVADKMIIVDAMQFAYTHPTGATLCFITQDVDYAYLLAVLQRPNWRTIVISKGTISSMLHVNCDMRMRWETDILLLRPSTTTITTAVRTTAAATLEQPKATAQIAESSSPRQEKESSIGSEEKKACVDVARVSTEENENNTTQQPERSNDSLPTTKPPQLGSHRAQNSSFQQFAALTPTEEWTDDVELLCSILRNNGGAGFKRTIGYHLQKTNPARFSNRMSVRSFIANAIDTGVVVETGEGSYKELSLPNDTAFPNMSFSKILPVPLRENVPEKVFKISEKMPYVLFVPKRNFPSGEAFTPKKTFVSRSLDGLWMILMFGSLLHLQNTAQVLPQLTGCCLVDWRNLRWDDEDALAGTCCACGTDLLESEVIYKYRQLSFSKEEEAYCCKCYPWENKAERKRAVNRVIQMLTLMAENDDVYITRKLLKKLLYQRYPGVCTTHKHAELWIDEAVSQDKVAPFKKEGQKSIQVCLASNLALANGEHPPDDLDTEDEERHVEALLLGEPVDFLSRKSVIQSLCRIFPKMDNPLWRSRVFHNGNMRKRFYVARGPFGQTVGVTDQEARESLERMTKLIREELAWRLESDNQLKPEIEVPTSSKDSASVESTTKISRETDDDETPSCEAKGADETAESPASAKQLVADAKATTREPEVCVESSPTPPAIPFEQASVSARSTIELPEKESVDTESGETKCSQSGNFDEVVHVELPQATADEEQSNDISDWDGESVDSAVIDARLLSRMKSMEGYTP